MSDIFLMYWLVAFIDFYICPCGDLCLHSFSPWDSVQLEMTEFFTIDFFFLLDFSTLTTKIASIMWMGISVTTDV